MLENEIKIGGQDTSPFPGRKEKPNIKMCVLPYHLCAG